MAKKVILEPGRPFRDFSLLTDYSTKNCNLNNINLKSNLGKLELGIPFLSAAMTSVTGYEMALALGKEGGLGVLPARLSVKEQVEIIDKIKGYEMGFVEDPVSVRDNATIDEAVRLVEKHGHSKIPITDRNNVFLGLFNFDKYLESNETPAENVLSVMTKVEELPHTKKANLTVKEAKKELQEKNYLIVLDDLGRLVKIAFKKDVENIVVGAAISTHKGWKKRVKACNDAGADISLIHI